MVEAAVDVRDVDAGGDEFGGGDHDVGGGAAVLEGARVCADGGVEGGGDGRGDADAEVVQEALDDVAGGGAAGVDDVAVAVAGVGAVVVDVDFAGGGGEDGAGAVAEAFPVAGVEADEGVEVGGAGGGNGFDEFGAAQEGVARGDGIFVPEAYVFAEAAQGKAEGDGGADGVAVGAEVGDDADALMLLQLRDEGGEHAGSIMQAAAKGKLYPQAAGCRWVGGAANEKDRSCVQLRSCE